MQNVHFSATLILTIGPITAPYTARWDGRPLLWVGYLIHRIISGICLKQTFKTVIISGHTNGFSSQSLLSDLTQAKSSVFSVILERSAG